MNAETIKAIIDALQGTSLLPVVLLAYLLKTYILNGNISKYFEMKKEENALLDRLDRNIEKIIERQEKQVDALYSFTQGNKTP